ncbi:MAG: hypothetical protein FWC34_05240 [Bacteroidetes bacterium]|nr:hypothetical protein [Bacteroidota bacterium]MCL2302855.1 hypothetical protein [Lentimicrobiaceae bacterium]
MAKKQKNPSLNIHDFFGTYNTYRIFALQSGLSIFPFANKLGQAERTTFTILPDFEYTSNQISARFAVFYAEYFQKEPIHCLLLENKMLINPEERLVSKTEKKLTFQTGFLFDEWLYLFNNQGLRCFDSAFADMDYFLLLFAKKNIENDMFLQFLENISSFKATDISYLLEGQQTAAEAKIVAFLRDFYCKYEVKANQLARKRKANLLAPMQQIPNQNLQFPIPIRLENDAVTDNLQLSEEYLAFLMEE